MANERIDRSRVLAFHRCPLSRYKNYHYRGQGIQLKRRNPAFLIGGYVHEGMDRLILDNPLPMVLEDLKIEYDGEVAEASLDIQDTDSQEHAKMEAWWVIKACLCVFSIRGLGRLRELYTVDETEHEELVELCDGIEFMARTDAMLRSIDSPEDLYIGSWKTAKRWDSKKKKDHAHDMQGVSEQFASEPRVGKIMGVQMVHLIKGVKEEIKDAEGNSQGWKTNNPLIYGWRRWNSAENGWEWAHSYWYTCKEPHVKKVTKKGEEWCEGGKKHRLTDEWESISVASEYSGGIEGWVQDLAQNTIQPNAVESEQFLDRFCIIQEPLFRHGWEKVKWQKQTSAQELRIKEALEAEPPLESPEHEDWLDTHFIQHTDRCIYPTKCQFYQSCWESIGEPLESGLYEPRKVNHPQEKRGEKGGEDE